MKGELKEFSLNKIKKEKISANGIFHTPLTLAKYLKEVFLRYAKEEDISEIVDLCCGNGTLLYEFKDDVIRYGSDTEADFINNCKETYPRVKANFFNISIFDKPFNRKFKHIVGNPPFGVKNKEIAKKYDFLKGSYLDCAFLQENINYLDNNGVFVSYVSPSIFYRNYEKGFIKKLIDEKLLSYVEWIENANFSDTNISVCLIVIEKNKQDDKITLKGEIESVLTLEQIKENDYTISKPCKEKEIEPYDEVQEMDKCLRLSLGSIEKSLKYYNTLTILSGDEKISMLFNQYVRDLEKAIRPYLSKRQANTQEVQELNLFDEMELI